MSAIIHVKDGDPKRYAIPGSRNPRERWTKVDPETAIQQAQGLASLDMGQRYDLVRVEIDGAVVFEARKGRAIELETAPAANTEKPKTKARKSF